MKKIEKGTPGYLNNKKRAEIIRTAIYFGIVIAILALGYCQTGTRQNMLTVVAVLGCLPSSKALVGVITRFPYASIDQKKAEEIAAVTDHLTVCYDMIITSRDKIMPVDCIVISARHVYGYTHYEKVDPDDLTKQIRSTLADNGYTDLTVKVLKQYNAFTARVEGLNRIAAVEKQDTKEKEETIRRLILTLSM